MQAEVAAAPKVQEIIMPNIITTVSGLALLCGVAVIAAPEMTEAVATRIVDRAEAMLAPDCDNRPLLCIDRRETALRGALARTASVASELRTREEEAGEAYVKAEQDLARNQLYLEEGRRILSSGGLGPFNFIGVNYSAESLEQQLRLNWQENQLLKAHAGAAQATRDGLAVARRDLIARKTAMRAALEILPSQRALISAEGMVAQVGESLAEIDAMLEIGRRVRSNAQDTMLRSTRELATDADAGLGAVASSGGFEVWLRGGAK
jgi:hypothetical protein